MSAVIIDGNALAIKIRQSLSERAAAVRKARSHAPRLAVVTVGENAATAAYRAATVKACREIGLEADVHSLSAWTSEKQTLKLLEDLGRDIKVDGIIVDLPLPKHIKATAVLTALPAQKDAEGVTPENYGRLFMTKTYDELQSLRLIAPPTALAVIELLQEIRAPLAGKRAIVVGRSNILGKPAAHLLSALDMTATLCHSKTQGIEEEVRRADIVVAALGKARFIKGSWLKEGAIVIDAGINREGDSLCGDVDFEEARKVVSYLTPVPGGVGPVTTAMLLANTVALAESGLKPRPCA